MEIVVVAPRFDGDKFDIMLGPSLTKLRTKCINVSDAKDSNVDAKTISNKYNVGIMTALHNNLINDDTIIILCKSDVSIADPYIAEKLEYVFSTQENVGMVGVKGVLSLNPNCELYHNNNRPLNGIVYNVKDLQNGEYYGTNKKGYFTNVIAVDDSFMAIRGSVIKNIGNNTLFNINTNDGYGIDATINILKFGYQVSIIDAFIISNEYTNVNYEIIEDICSKINLKLPASIDTLNIVNNFIVDVEV